MRIGVLLYDGFDEVDAVGPFEVLSNVRFVDSESTVVLLSEHAPQPITASHNMVLLPQAGLDEKCDLLVVPGGLWIDRREDIGVYAEYLRGVLPEVIKRHHEAGTVVCSVCTGAMLLEKAGLLAGREATTHWAAKEDLAAAGVIVIDERVVDAGDIVTCGGVTSGFDMALWLVERFWNVELADGIAKAMEIENRATACRAAGAPQV